MLKRYYWRRLDSRSWRSSWPLLRTPYWTGCRREPLCQRSRRRSSGNVAFLGGVAQIYPAGGLPLYSFLGELARHQETMGMGWATAAHIAAGGEVSNVPAKENLTSVFRSSL